MTDVVLTTFNARHQHTAFGLRYLLANLGDLRDATHLTEYTLNDSPEDVAREILAHSPRIVGISVYIWNADLSCELARVLRASAPNLTIVLGGPEVSYEWEAQEIVGYADYVVTGEADLAFPMLCRDVLNDAPPAQGIIHGGAANLAELQLPYEEYDNHDVAHRVVYVEASRGCPFACEFCLSALDKGVRRFDLEEFLGAMGKLLERGVRQFKFVDRTFNLAPKTSLAILDFFWNRYTPDLFLHFEMIPDQLPDLLRDSIARFPAGALQFEVGIQTFNPEVMHTISRRQNLDRLEANFAFLRENTGVHVHADLIAGLPGENLESFGQGFDRLWSLGPQEIQVGILKRLRGTPIIRHTEPFELEFNSSAPYDVLRTKHMDAPTLDRIKRFAHYWDRVANSGRFRETLPLLLGDSPFARFLDFSDNLYATTGLTHSIALEHWVAFLFDYLAPREGANPVAHALARDYTRDAPRRIPRFLKEHVGRDFKPTPQRPPAHLPPRQARHLA